MKYSLLVAGFVSVLSACSGVQAPPVVNVNVGANSSSKTDLTLTQNNSDSTKGEKDGAAQAKSKSPQQVIATFEKPFIDPDAGISIDVTEITGDSEASFLLLVPGKKVQRVKRAVPGWELATEGPSGTVKIRLLNANIVSSTVTFVVSK